ncbi:MAG: hypothetical protein LAO56_03980 [Acidobacteriia bacterium]|nr:hypothetical protein [Terriglobia bacterium]
MNPDPHSKVSNAILLVAVLVCLLQLFWFGSKCFHQIDYDGMAYTGIARHLSQGQFRSAINAFRSPLLSWIIAAVSFGRNGLVWVGKWVSVSAFVLSLALLYAFAKALWRSAMAGAVAVLLFALGRGHSAVAVGMIVPDFLFAALALVYFIVLLRCLSQGGGEKNWFYLGIVHGLAYLAKSFALPWLALCTLVAAILSDGPWKKRVTRVVLAALVPVVVTAGWATVLHSKYGVFTAGTQFKANLLQWTLRAYRERQDTNYLLLTDTTKHVDEFLVDDPMPPHSWPWTYRIDAKRNLPNIILAEKRNVPSVLKEIVIVATPGGVLAFIIASCTLLQKRRQYVAEWRVALVIATGAVTLVLTYSMLVFDARYLFPLTPLLLAVGAGFLVRGTELNHEAWRKISIALVIAGVAASLVYPSSPFRRITRDFQAICYDAGRHLRVHSGSTVVSLGSGPFPDVGVGWEAGYKAAYFGGWRIIGTAESLPSPSDSSNLMLDLKKASPDAILVWGKPSEARYAGLIRHLDEQYPSSTVESILDPVLGEVGAVVFTNVNR